MGYEDALQQVDVAEVLASASGTFDETIAWSDASQADIRLVISGASAPELVILEDVGGGPESEPGPCPILLEFSAEFVLTTGDGRMDDAFQALAGTGGDRISVEHRIPDPAGTIDVPALAAEGVDVEPNEVRVNLSFSDVGTPFSGQLLPQPIGGFDDDATALGSWPAGDEEDE